VGAFNGAFLAGDASLEGVERLAAFWKSIRRRDLFPIELLAIIAGLVGRRDHFCDPLALRTLILRAEFGFDRLEEAPVPFFPVAADLANGEAVVLSDGDVVEALMASAAIPGIFPPVEIGERMLIDGSLVADRSLSEAEALGASTIYLLPTAAPSDRVRRRSPIDVAARAMFLPAYHLALATSRTLASRLDVHVVPPPSMAAHSLTDLRATTELIDRSYQRARAWLADLRPALVA
jgi:NTE family protein